MGIEVKKILQISEGTAPYSYNWTTSNACVTFSQSSGVSTDGVVETTVIYEDESCFLASPTINIEITDANGCTLTEAVTIANPCSGFSNSGITVGTGNVFSTSVGSPGS